MSANARSIRLTNQQLLMLLRALSRPGHSIELTEDGLLLRIRPPGSPTTKPGVRIPLAISAGAESRGLIARIDGQLALTAAGKAWVRRQLAMDDPFQEQHQQRRHRVSTTAKGRPSATVIVNEAESPLAWLRRRKDRDGRLMLDDNQFEAGERLRRDFTFAALGPRVTADWSNMSRPGRQQRGSAPSPVMSDNVIGAKDRVFKAITAAGPELGRILMDVCCLLKGIEAAEAALGLPKRSGKVVLQLALTALARHYGLIQPAKKASGVQPIRHWGHGDYRPTLNPAPPPK